MVGIASLAPQQGQQAPGQAPMPGMSQPMPGMMPKPGAATPAAEVSQYAGMPLPQLIALFQQRPSGPLLGVITKQAEALELQKKMADQAAMAQAQQQQGTIKDMAIGKAVQAMQPTQMAAHGGIMHGYAGGGAVAFTNGGDVEIQRILKKGPYERTPEENEILRAAGVGVTRRTMPEGGVSAFNRLLESPFLRRAFTGDAYKLSPEELAKRNDTGATTERIFRGLGGNQFVEPAPVSTPAGGTAGTRQGKSGIADIDIGPSMALVAPPMQPARRPPTAAKPQGQGVGSLMSAVEQTGTPAPDTLSDIESKGIADINALKGVLNKQGTVDPELMKLREAAYKSSQDIAARRERDRLAMLEAAQKASGTSLLDNQEALLRMAGALSGAKRFGEGLSKIAGEAGVIKGEQRKELQRVQDVARQEQKAIEDLNQALADKRVADRSGDVSRIEAANRAVAEAQLKVTDLRSGIQKERALQADREEQRKIAREQMANQLKVAQIGAAAKEGAAGLAEQRLALQAMRADPNYAAIVKELTEAKKLAGLSSSPTMQARLRAAEKAARDLATSYGVTPGMMGMGGAGAPAPEGREIDFNAIGKK